MEDLILSNSMVVSDLIEDVERLSENIPFGNSRFQNEELVVKRNLTQGRQLRDGLLSLNSRIQALREAYYARKLEDLNIREKKIEIKKIEVEKRRTDNELEKELLEIQIDKLDIEIEKILSNRNHCNKIIKDAMVEMQDLYLSIKSLPEYTREEFENEEKEHITLLYKKELLGISEAVEKLTVLGVNIDNSQQKILVEETIKKIKGCD